MLEHDNNDIQISQVQQSSNSSSPISSLVYDHLESFNITNQFTNAAFHNSDASISSPASIIRSTQSSLKSSSTTATTTTTNSTSNQSKRKQDQLRFQQIFNNTNSKSKSYKRCTCRKNQKQFDCHECTQPFPIQVRRSRDGESGILYNLQHNTYHTQSQANQKSASSPSKTCNESRMDANLINSVEEESDEGSGSSNSSSSNCYLSTQNPHPAILKPTPFKTVSPTLLSLLAMSNPNSRFVPPPNISLSYSKKS